MAAQISDEIERTGGEDGILRRGHFEGAIESFEGIAYHDGTSGEVPGHLIEDGG
jgi:hypothetical protein